jgi:peptide/nickel transport system permease protein
MTLTSSEALAGEVDRAGALKRAPASGGRRAIRALFRKPTVVASAIYLLLLVLLAVFAPMVSALEGANPYDFDTSALNSALGGAPKGAFGGISATHWFGVEPQSGRDIFARIAYGARTSLTISITTTIVTTALGVVLGVLAGFFGGLVDGIISRIMDLLMAFPALIFMIALLSALPAGNRVALLVVVLGVFGWPYIGRVIRSQTMSLRNREFVEAARVSGAGTGNLVFREVVPNLRGTIIVIATIAVPGYIGTEAALSFLGVGVVPPTPSWGQMIAASVDWYSADPMYFIVPGAFLFATVMAFMVIGDHLQKVLDGREG